MTMTSCFERLHARWLTTLGGLCLGWMATAALGACDEDDEAESCVQGETQECVCAEGMGVQTCLEGGTWGECSCGGASSSGSGGSGGDSSGDSGDSGGDSSDSGGGSEQSCCLNGSFYDCPSSEAADTCFSSFDPSGCTPDPARDVECDTGDDSGGDSGDSGDDSGGDTCSDAGYACEVNGDCCEFPSALCVEGTCADTCSFGSDCMSGCCAPTELGESVCAPADYCA